MNFIKARWLIKVWNSGKLEQLLVYQRGISGVDAIEKIAQMLSPTSEDSLSYSIVKMHRYEEQFRKKSAMNVIFDFIKQ